jgi:hypothetical protein
MWRFSRRQIALFVMALDTNTAMPTPAAGEWHTLFGSSGAHPAMEMPRRRLRVNREETEKWMNIPKAEVFRGVGS